MPLEMYVFIEGKEEAVNYEIISPGEKSHILTLVKKDNKMIDKIYEVYCRMDDKLSTVSSIYPRVISNDFKRAIYRREDVENLAIIINPGDEINLPIKQRVTVLGKRKFMTGHVALTHR